MKAKLVRESLNEYGSRNNKGWQLASDGTPEMYRFSGKTWPSIGYEITSREILARDDNGPRPSATLSTSNINTNGIKELLKGISYPHPTEEQISELLRRINSSQ